MSVAAETLPEVTEACRLTLSGRVQGVGFRPFVYRLARANAIRGWVLNGSGRVEIVAEGMPADLERFCRGLTEDAPPAAKPRLDDRTAIEPRGHRGFEIRASHSTGDSRITVPPDQFACPDCLAEMAEPADRRHAYPFINCTQCGPRYTIIESLPYDRPNTSMAGFELCPACRAEYEDPLDRRFHAQPLACPDCGPGLVWSPAPQASTGEALAACIEALQGGKIVGVRGIGGYHLLCDATDDRVVRRLRNRKQRPDKPLAVMVPECGDDGLEAVRELADPTDEEAELLADPRRPIVLVRGINNSPLSSLIAPGLSEIGFMLPYSPLHHLILTSYGGPLVATSGNNSGEPVLTDIDEAEARLAGIAEAFLHHDRPIVRPADDPVYRRIGQALQPLRLGRGTATLEMELACELPEPVLAAGAFMKTTVDLGDGRRIIVSPHIGDLSTPRSRRVFETVAHDLCSLFDVEPAVTACDAHPDYPSTRWAHRQSRPAQPVYHHHAHASAVYGEFGVEGPLLCLTWDGTGLGPDGSIWGGELLLGTPGNWRRVGTLRPYRLPGGDRAAREGWRAALGLCWEADTRPPTDWSHDLGLLRSAWEKGLNAPLTSSAGRLFDAAAALIGLRATSSFEGHAPMLLEALAASTDRTLDLHLDLRTGPDGLLIIDWADLLPMLIDESLGKAERARTFHAALAHAMADQATRARADGGPDRIGLSGGVFQNRLLTEMLTRRLERRGFEVLLPEAIPLNDAGISFGQVIECAALLTLESNHDR
ncbi:MAG: carbamoyltransferase HypF [Xanthomonadales bacterium]|nr:carbamoyltransferase HypF [Xanthomonadales bacterium]